MQGLPKLLLCKSVHRLYSVANCLPKVPKPKSGSMNIKKVVKRWLICRATVLTSVPKPAGCPLWWARSQPRHLKETGQISGCHPMSLTISPRNGHKSVNLLGLRQCIHNKNVTICKNGQTHLLILQLSNWMQSCMMRDLWLILIFGHRRSAMTGDYR